MRTSRGKQGSRTREGRTHPVGIDTSPSIVAEDKLNEASDGGTFVRKQSMRGLKMHHGV